MTVLNMYSLIMAIYLISWRYRIEDIFNDKQEFSTPGKVLPPHQIEVLVLAPCNGLGQQGNEIGDMATAVDTEGRNGGLSRIFIYAK